MARDIYLDNAATTRPDPAVLAAMARADSDCYANASTVHRMGVAAGRLIERARASVAAALGAELPEVVFTSGGTEANNLALKGAAAALADRGDHLIISAVEHPSVSRVAQALACRGLRLSIAPVDREGVVDPAAVRSLLTGRTILVSVMHANNETGAIQPLHEIAMLCRAQGALFHTDACQSFTRRPLDTRGLPADLVTVDAHKLHGPKGVGALYVRRGLRLTPLLDGGGQENGLRSGTYNTAGITGFGEAVALAMRTDAAAITTLRDRFEARLAAAIPDVRINGPVGNRLGTISSVTLPRPDAKTLLHSLSRQGIYLSAGSACAAGRTEPSQVLLAMGLAPEAALRTVRVSLSRFTTEQEVDAAADALARAVREVGG